MYIFYFFGCIKKSHLKPKTLCNIFKNAHFVWSVVFLPLNPEAGRPPIIVYVCPLIQYAHSYPLHQETVMSEHNLRMLT